MLCGQDRAAVPQAPSPHGASDPTPGSAMNAHPAPITDSPRARRSAWLEFAADGLGFLRRLLPGRLQSDKSLEALAALGEDDVHCLSESGQRLRREARRARGRSRSHAAGTGWLSATVGLAVPGTGLASEQVCRPPQTVAQARLSNVHRATANGGGLRSLPSRHSAAPRVQAGVLSSRSFG
jgi:hypothetical protein